MAAAAAAAAAASRRRPGLSLLLLLLQLHTLLQPVWSQADELKQKMEAHQVIPDVIQTAPSEVLEVTYENGVQVNMGNELTPTQVQRQPVSLSWPSADDGQLYTLILTDPDAPSREKPEKREFKHWLVVNVPGKRLADGQTLTEFIGSGPPPGSGLHRYVYLVYRQPRRLELTEPVITNRQADGRAGFRAQQWATAHKLEGPVAGNFYQAQWDDYVPKLYEQLSG